MLEKMRRLFRPAPIPPMFIVRTDLKPGTLIPIAEPGQIIIVEEPVRTITIIASPFRADSAEGRLANVAYARKACEDAVKRGETPFASHLLFPQFMDDNDPVQRKLGMEGNYKFWPLAVKVAFYIDRGWSSGMTEELVKCITEYELPYQIRKIEDAPRQHSDT